MITPSMVRRAIHVFIPCALFLPQLFAQPGLDQAQPFQAYFNGVFPANTPGSAPAGSWSTQNAFPGLSFPEPVRIVEHPREKKLVVVSKTGPIWIFDDSPQTTGKQMLLDLSNKTNYPLVGEGGVSGFAFHPEFGNPLSPNRGFIYVAYRFTPGISGPQAPEQVGFNRISRFTVADGSSTASLSSELVLIHQYDRQQWHIGGSMFFGSDGFLYIGCGDEGNEYSRSDATQRVDGGLWSGVLRIDVDNDPSRSVPVNRQPEEAAQINSAADSSTQPRPASWPASYTQGYSIPVDNPFRDNNGASLGEFYAIGLRHPWTISQDPSTGYIWYADVGESAREEIGKLVKGGNHQWGFKEGLDMPGPIPQPSSLLGIQSGPVLDYSHNVGKAVIGAGVYRGSVFPELYGKYIFADFNDGQLWAIDAASNGPIAIRSKGAPPAGVQFITQLPAGFSAGINAFGLTRDGRVLMAKTAGGSANGGTILNLIRQGTPTPQPPALLSQTGAFQNLASLIPAPGFIPYSMLVPFWSDNAIKSRWFAIPNDGTHNTAAEKVTFSADGDWNLPVGSVTIKHFEMAMDQRNPSLTKRLETRFLIHGNQGWYGVTYRWNAAGTDAELLYDGETEKLSITDDSGKTSFQEWTYPSRTQCMTCHTPAAGGSLGLMNRQLNKDHFYVSTGRSANQLTTLSYLGIFQTPVTQTNLPAITTLKAANDSTASVSQRARSYLDSNCAYCHQPGGVRANFDARYTTPLENASILNGPLVESLGISGGAVVSPGSLSKSILHYRAASVGKGHSMPPLAKGVVDSAGVGVLADWIYGLAPANGSGAATLGNSTTSAGNFSDSHHPSLFVNKSDSFTNNGTSPLVVSMASFSFHATKKGNPVTPFAAIVTGTDSFSVAAIGTTRPASDYQAGQNHFLFSNSGSGSFILAPGSTFVTGFMDCHPDGTGWGGGSVISAATSGGNAEDDVWALLPDPLINQTSPYNPAVDTPSVTLGQTILATNTGKSLTIYPNLQRSYKYATTHSVAVQTSASGDGSELITNGSFEQSTPNPPTWLRIPVASVPGWDTSSPLKLIEIWKSGFLGFPSQQGNQLAEMDAQTLEQTLATVPGATLTWSFYHRGRDGSDTVALDLGPPGNLTRVKLASTSKSAWVKYEGTYVVPPGQTQTKFVLVPISGASSLLASNLIDNVSVKQTLPDRDGDGVPDHLDVFPDDPDESADSDGDGIGDNSDPFPQDPNNGGGSSGDHQLILNGSFEQTNPKPATWLMIDKSEVTGWNTDSPDNSIEIWKSGFLNVPAHDGGQLCEMDGQTLEQTLATVPGATLHWSFHHRGREGIDTVALDIGSTSGLTRVKTASTGKSAWLKYEGTYVVPAGQTMTRFVLVPISGANGSGPLTSANFIDNVSVIQVRPATAPDTDGDGVPDDQDAFPNDPDESTDSDGDGIGDNSDPFPNDPTNGGGTTDVEMIVNGSFEQSTPQPSSWLRIPQADVPGWSTNAITGLIEIWKSGFLNISAQDGGQLAEMDANSLEQTFATIPGATLNWSFYHRGRDGFDTVALEIGAPSNPTRINTFSTGKSVWVKYQGTYLVPPGQTQTKFSLVPVSGASSLISSNMIDDVSVVQSSSNSGGITGLQNGSFEQNLDAWTYANVTVVQTNPHAGSKALDLKNGYIEQSISGLAPGEIHSFHLAYRSQPGVIGELGDAIISINGTPIGEIHNASPEYLDQNGFEFTPATANVTLRIQSLETGNAGLLIDSLRIEKARLPLPPSSPGLVNGSFEDQSGLSGVNPHVSGFDLPGWLVTRENVDPIQVSAFAGWTAVDGAWVLDLGGHGPGGIAQTVTGLVPNSMHTLSFSYARHRYWDQEPVLKAEVYANGSLAATLQRTQSQKVPAWTRTSLQIPASASGTITIEFRSISQLVGGGIIIDHVTLLPASSGTAPSTSLPTESATHPETEFISEPALILVPDTHTIRMNAERAGTYVLERSTDLRDWEKVSEIDCSTPGPLEFPEARPPSGIETKIFYRVGRLPDPLPDP